MKKCLQIFFLVIAYLGSVFTTINAQAIPKVERVDIFATNIIIKDSLFLSDLDSLIFNSICQEVINKKSNLKIFNVYSKKNDNQENSYMLYINLDNQIQIHNENDFKGCFDYKGYLFLWFNDVPPKLLSVSNQKRKLTYIKGVPHIANHTAEFSFDYTNEILSLTGICCFW